jgi:hypothetical protein
MLNAGGDGYVATTIAGFEVVAAATEPPTVRLSRGTKVFGVLTAPDGTPFDNGQVFLTKFDTLWVNASGMRGQGRYEVPGLSPGRYLVSTIGPVTASTRRFVPSESRFVEVKADDREVRFDARLVAAENATATLFDSSSIGRSISPESLEALRGSTLEITDADRVVIVRRKGVIADELRVHVDASLAPGTFWAHATTPGQPDAWQRLEVVAGKEASVVFTLARGRDGAPR